MTKDWNWISLWNEQFGAKLTDISDQTSLLAIQGPDAVKVLQNLTSVDLSSIPYYQFKIGEFAGVKNVILSNTGYTGAGGFEIYIPNEDAEKVWNAIMEEGKAFLLKPVGLGARDTLRMEMAFCLYGNDINDSTSPIEAGLGWITKFNKDFINKPALLQQKEQGVQRKLVGFEMIDKGIPRKDYNIEDANGNIIGNVTSGTQSPTLNKAIGMGYVETKLATPGSEIFIEIRGKKLKAVVTKTPFITNK